MQFPAHKASLTLEHNGYKDYYDSVVKAVQDEDERSTWVEGEREKALETGEIWTLHWYPDTPVGFFRLAASTLEALLEAANKV